MKGVRLGLEELIRAYGITRRLAVRIGALLARGLEVTATLIEIAGPGSAVEKLLLHPETLSGVGRLDTATVARLAAETGADSESELVVVESEGKRVLALAEEVLAEQAATARPQRGWREAPAEALPAVVQSDATLAPARLLGKEEIGRLFGPEEIARIKLDALTGGDAETRISALRKLLYAPLPAREKGGIYLRVLLESEGRVRTEVIKGLESLGFNRDMADAIQGTLDGDPRKRNAALRRMGDLLGTLEPAERQIVLAVLVEMFRETRPEGPADPLLRVLDQTVPVIAGHPEVLPEMTRVCVQHLIADPARVGPTLRDLVLKMAAAAIEREGAPQASRPVLDKLWDELSTVREPAPRALLLSLLMEAEYEEKRRRGLCDLAVAELLREDQDELARQKLGHNMVALGVPAARAIIHRFAAASVSERAVLVSFLDILSVEEDLPPEERNEIARHLIEALKVASRRLRMEILRTRVFHQPDLDAELRESLVRELLPLLRATEQPEVCERAAVLLESLGAVSAKGLFDMIRQSPSAPEADVAVRVLGGILARKLDPGSALAVQLVPSVCRFLSKRVADPSNQLGGYAAALAEVAASAVGTPERAHEAFDLIAGRLGSVRYYADVVEGIGRLGACAAATTAQHVRAVHLLGDLVERPADEEETQLREVNTDKGKVFERAGRLDFDSATLPVAVRGLRAIALLEHVSPTLRGRIVERMLRVWEGVAAWRVVWGPRSSEELARSVGVIGADAGTDDATRARIIHALGQALERLSVVRALGDVFAASSDSREVNRLVVRTALDLLDKWIEPEITPEELSAVLNTAARAASRPGVSSRSSLTRQLQRRTAELLFDALALGRPWCREPLERMRDSSTVPVRLRKDIADRLQQTLALEKQ